ncbi:MAG: RNA polymerase sigma factor [Acidobacteria bacterium]|nr:RNA polymerase sigma factor [Acidobacteriota bacterium]
MDLEQSAENTAALLEGIREGDRGAEERLFLKMLPKLQRWARGRLPLAARSMTETDDLVQSTLLKAFRKVSTFEHRGEGAFLAYLRQILMNELKATVSRQRGVHDLEADISDPSPGPVDRLLTNEARHKYEAGLASISEQARQAVILRLEFNYTFQEIADALDKPSSDAARMYVTRAIQQLAKAMSS